MSTPEYENPAKFLWQGFGGGILVVCYHGSLDGAITPKVIGRQAFIRHSPISVARLLGE